MSRRRAIWGAIVCALLASSHATYLYGQVVEGVGARLVSISDEDPATCEQGVATVETNVTFICRNNLLTVGNQQFATYYYRNPADVGDADNNTVLIARRTQGESKWSIFKTRLTANNVEDSHDAISFGIDGAGFMHLIWGSHSEPMRYAKSLAPVTGNHPIEMSAVQSWLLPGRNEARFTYPEFYSLPDGDLLLMHRNAVARRSDKPIDNYLRRYDVQSQAWTAVNDTALLSGHAVPGDAATKDLHGAYPNMLAFDSQNSLFMTWCWRHTGAYQTNRDILFAKSADEGRTWSRQDGTKYVLPISQASAGPSAAEVILSLPEQSSLLNSTGMAIDKNDRPVIATWYAPNHLQGDDTRQYMLVYYDGKQWQRSQISNRPPERLSHDADVYDMSAPMVLIDRDNRVLVILRYDGRGGVISVAHSRDCKTWEFLDLTRENMGKWEPTCDLALWRREQKLSMLYQPVSRGESASPVSVLEWDPAAYFGRTEP